MVVVGGRVVVVGSTEVLVVVDVVVLLQPWIHIAAIIPP